MITPQEEFWSKEFGTSYTARNRVEWQKRIPFWRSIIEHTKPDSILECGANAGWNLRAIREINPAIHLYGIDVNSSAVEEANKAGLNVFEASASAMEYAGGFDLTVTAGMLIHVGPADIMAVMERIAAASNRYVLAVEYAAEKEEEIIYRGHAERLWKRPFGKLYEAIGMKIVAEGEAEGFDRCRYWLLRK